MVFIDARVPVRLSPAGEPPADAAFLLEGDGKAPEGAGPSAPVARFTPPAPSGHAIGCACCTPRGPVAEALGRLFLARARGEVGFFRSVIARPASAAGEAAIRAALADDPLVSARFRLAEQAGPRGRG
jgi:hypothetical protein